MIDNPISDLISKDLRRWFKEKWVDVSRKDKDGKHPPCGRSDAKLDNKGYPKCRPSKKVSEDTPTTTRGISAEEKKKMTRRKRSKPQGVGGKPTMVKSDFNPFNAGGKRLIDAYAGSGRTEELRRIMEAMMETPEVKTEETGRDPCCQEAFNAQLTGTYARSEQGIQEVADTRFEGDFCAALRYLLEFDLTDSHDWLSKPIAERNAEMEWHNNAFPNDRVSVEKMNEHYQKRYDEAKKVLDNWDACSAAKLPDDGMFTASANLFETAWDSISKDFYFDNSPKGEIAAGEYVSPRAKGITQIDDAKGRKTGIGGFFLNRGIDIEANQEDGNPSSQNTTITDDAINDDRNRRFDTKPYNALERKERGEDEIPNDPQSPSNFRRGGSLPRTTKVTTDMPNYYASRFNDMKGNEMDSKNAGSGYGGWDRTGKRVFRSNKNKPTHFEGQEREYATHVGVNLSNLGRTMLESNDVGEDQAIKRIGSILGHEQIHSAIDQDLREAIKRGDLPLDHFNAAHETGAYIGENADLDDEEMETKVNEKLARHPNTSWANLYGKTPKRFQGINNQLKMPRMAQSSGDIKQASFEQAWSSITKGKFRGYTQSNISDRPYRQAEHRVWDVSRRNKKAKTRRRYARQLSRGNFRPEMRRQLGVGGKRASTKR